MKTIIILLLFLTLGCSEESEHYVQPELQGFYNTFLVEAKLRGIEIDQTNLIMTIEPGMLSKYGGNGVTRKTKDQTYIYIDQGFWDSRKGQIEMTAMHELGHALLNREHTSGWSLMNPNISGQKQWPLCMEGNPCREGLFNELFGKWL